MEPFLARKSNMRIVFMGTPPYATTILKALVGDATMEVVLLVTQEDKPVGRKQLLTPPDTKAWALRESNIGSLSTKITAYR